MGLGMIEEGMRRRNGFTLRVVIRRGVRLRGTHCVAALKRPNWRVVLFKMRFESIAKMGDSLPLLSIPIVGACRAPTTDERLHFSG